MSKGRRVSLINRPHKVKVTDYFTSSGYPTHNYVERPMVRRENELSYADKIISRLNQQQPVVIEVSGASQTGKTILIEHCLNSIQNARISISGSEFRNEGEFWSVLAARLNVQIITERSEKTGAGADLAGVVKLDLVDVDTVETFHDIRQEVLRKLRPQTVIFVDDLHFLPIVSYEKVMRAIKLLTQPAMAGKGIKVILAFIPTRQILDANIFGDMGGRLPLSIRLPLWRPEELRGIAMENLRDAPFSLIGSMLLAEECFGLPSIMQEYCLLYCQDRFPDGEILIYNDQPNIIEINNETQRERLSYVFETVADTFWHQGVRQIYNELIGNDMNPIYLRRNFDNKVITLRQMVWYAMTSKYDFRNPLMGLRIDKSISISTEELVGRISRVSSDDVQNIAQVIGVLTQMRDEAWNNYQTRIVEGKSTVDPVFDFDEHENVLEIFSPRFLMSLRHSTEHYKRFRRT